MSKNINIQEGGIGRQFTADKLTTALVGGGSCNWVPEDEIQLGTKDITENGTYIAANDGEYGYSQVTVNVSGAEKIITGTTDSGEPVVTTIDVVDGTVSEIILGDYFIVTYDGDGNVAKIEDNNGNRCLLTYENVTMSGFNDAENNHYTINFDGNGNISQVIDPNAQDCELRDSDGDGKIDIISIGTVLSVIPDIETGDTKIIDENDNDVTDDYIGTSITGVDSNDTPWRANITDSTSGDGASIGITPVTPATTPGASIVGVDSNGNKIVAEVKNNGTIETVVLPSSIEIVTLPTKKAYTVGEAIDYSGIVVVAKNANGSVWENPDYPNGIIPINELYFPETVAPAARDGVIIIDGDMEVKTLPTSNYDNPVFSDVYALANDYGRYAGSLSIDDPDRSLPIAQHTPGILCLVLNKHVRVIACRGTNDNVLIAGDEDFSGFMPQWLLTGFDGVNHHPAMWTSWTAGRATGEYTYNSKTVYWAMIFVAALSNEISYPINATSNELTRELAWYLVYGDYEKTGAVDIPVQWNRIRDGKTLESKFAVSVNS